MSAEPTLAEQRFRDDLTLPYGTRTEPEGMVPVALVCASDAKTILSELDNLRTKLATAEAQIKVAREALTPSADTKAAYIGEFGFNINHEDERGVDFDEPQFVTVPWTTIKEIMAAIRARSALVGDGG